MMDEQLIAEVEHHGVIYNRQKYSINNMGVSGGAGHGSSGGGVNKYETKEEAWHVIAMKLQSDVETCKKRWKYLRERYVSQRKQGDPPVYEHLSRPYLEKMKFLDQHIQPRKSYRNVSNFLTSPNTNSSFNEYNMDSSKSNGSTKNLSFPMHQQQHPAHSTPYQQDGIIKTEEDQTLRDFAAAVASHQLHQINPLHPQFHGATAGSGTSTGSGNVGISAVHPHINNYDQYRENDSHSSQNLSAGPPVGNGVPSSTSSSMKSPSPQPPAAIATNMNGSSEINDDHQFVTNGSKNNMKKPRVQMTSQYLDTSDTSDDNVSPPSTMHRSNTMNESHSMHSHQSHQQQQQHLHQQQQQQQQHYNKMFSNMARNMTGMNHNTPSQASALYPSNSDILFSLYQQMTPAAAVAQQERNTTVSSSSATRSSEHLLGELVTSELLKMNKERRKIAQKRILEILFFED